MVDSDGNDVVVRSLRYLDYVDAIGAGRVWSRADFMRAMRVPYSTAVYNLEKAVKIGALNRYYGMATDQQPGWLYALPQTMPRLQGV